MMRLTDRALGLRPLTADFELEVHRHGVLRIGRPGRSSGVTRYYWRLIDPAHSLVEIGFDPATGRLIDVCVPLFNGTVEKLSDREIPGEGRAAPAFDPAPWAESEGSAKLASPTIDVAGRLRLQVRSNALRIVLFEDAIDEYRWPAANVATALNASSELIALEMVQLSGVHTAAVAKWMGSCRFS